MRRSAMKTRTKPLPARGKKARRNDAPDRTWRGIVQLRHHGVCQSCHEQLGTQCHHLFPKGSHPELRHDASNGAHLCDECHRDAHAHPIAFRDAFARDWPYFDAIYDSVTDRPILASVDLQEAA